MTLKYFRWTDDETAIVLNHVDWCLVNKRDYWSTIHDALELQPDRVPSLTQIMTCLKKFCQLQTPKVHYHGLVDCGTVVLEDATIPESIAEAMERRRKSLGLGALKNRTAKIPRAQSGTSERNKRECESAPEGHNSFLKVPPALVLKIGQSDRKRKRQTSVSYDESSSDNISSDADALPIQVPTGTEQPPPFISPTADTDLAQLHKRVASLEEVQKSMAEREATTERILDMSIMCLTWVFREQVGPKNTVPYEIFSTMQLIERTIRGAPGNAFIRLVEDLRQANIIREEYQDLARHLIGRLDFAGKVEFPPMPDVNALARQWRRIRSPLKDTLTHEGAPASTVQLVMAGDFSKIHLADLANAKEGGIHEPHPWISTRGPDLDNTFTAQHLMAVVLCQLLFYGTETMCEVTPSSWAFQIYRTVADREEIKRIDKMAFQLFSQEPRFENEVIPNRVRRIRQCLEACASEFNGSLGYAPLFRRRDFMSSESVRRALSLKRTLMLSCYEYQIYFAKPGMAFNQVWMEAEDNKGQSLDPLICNEMRVSLCLFPGLVQAPTRKLPADADISAALIHAKKFFPTGEKTSPSLDYEVVLAKAIVLVYEVKVDSI